MKKLILVFEDNVFANRLQVAKSMNIIIKGQTTFENMNQEEFLKLASTLKGNDFELEKESSEESN